MNPNQANLDRFKISKKELEKQEIQAHIFRSKTQLFEEGENNCSVHEEGL